MNLDQVQIEVRPRSHWEAIDLGCLMVRRWAKLMYASWFVVATPVFVLTWLFLPSSPVWAAFILWWLKPLYERLPLVVVSSAIFGDLPKLTTVLKTATKVIPPGMFAALTYRRLSVNRAFETPVTVLEKLDSHDRARRFSVLKRSVGNQSFWLTIMGVHIETFLSFGFIVGAYMLIPEQTEIDWWGLLVSNVSGEQDWLSNLLYFFAIGLVGPVYVASGFSLYLNRRVELEAWDIELGFKRMVARVTTGALIVGCFTLSTPLFGDVGSENAEIPTGPEASRLVIEEVLAGPEFHEVSTTKVPKFLKDYFESENEKEDDSAYLEKWRSFFKAVASFFEIFLWLGVSALIIYLVMRFRVWEFTPRESSEKYQRPAALMGMKISEESLPDNIVQVAQQFWERDEVREALSLLYRASLATLFSRFDVRFKASDTEGECLAKARHLDNDAVVHYFAHLTRCWQMLAYGHMRPTETEFANLLQTWPFTGEGKK